MLAAGTLGCGRQPSARLRALALAGDSSRLVAVLIPCLVPHRRGGSEVSVMLMRGFDGACMRRTLNWGPSAAAISVRLLLGYVSYQCEPTPAPAGRIRTNRKQALYTAVGTPAPSNGRGTIDPSFGSKFQGNLWNLILARSICSCSTKWSEPTALLLTIQFQKIFDV